MDFTIDAADGAARACTIRTAHSTIRTPVFMPVGTVGAVKALDATDVERLLDAQIILANTYHMYLRPGSRVGAEFGGLHGFTKFSRSFLTDSGGFQAFSLRANTKNPKTLAMKREKSRKLPEKKRGMKTKTFFTHCSTRSNWR